MTDRKPGKYFSWLSKQGTITQTLVACAAYSARLGEILKASLRQAINLLDNQESIVEISDKF